MEARVVKSVVAFLFCFNLALHSNVFSHVGLLQECHGHSDHEEIPEEPHEILEEETPVAVCSNKSLVLGTPSDPETSCESGGENNFLVRGLGIIMALKVMNVFVIRTFSNFTESFYFKPVISRFWHCIETQHRLNI
jgi:hypothetical protein